MKSLAISAATNSDLTPFVHKGKLHRMPTRKELDAFAEEYIKLHPTRYFGHNLIYMNHGWSLTHLVGKARQTSAHVAQRDDAETFLISKGLEKVYIGDKRIRKMAFIIP